MAKLTGENNEIKIYNHLASQSRAHPGSDRILSPLDSFKVQGPNGEHDVLVLQVLGPQLQIMYDDDPAVIHRAIKPLVRQIVLGISFLHDCGIVHAGQSTVSAHQPTTHRYSLDLHRGNIAFEIPDLDGKSEQEAMNAVGLPYCAPVLLRDLTYPTDSFPKYLVVSGNLVESVDPDDLRIKIIDFGEGSLQWYPKPSRQALRSRSFFQHRTTSEPAHPIGSSGAGGNA